MNNEPKDLNAIEDEAQLAELPVAEKQAEEVRGGPRGGGGSDVIIGYPGNFIAR